MPKFTIDLTDKAVDKLQAPLARANSAGGTDYTLGEWLQRVVEEMAIADDLRAAVQAIAETEESAKTDRINDQARTVHDELLAALQATGEEA